MLVPAAFLLRSDLLLGIAVWSGIVLPVLLLVVLIAGRVRGHHRTGGAGPGSDP
jgi:hypothetical protein